MGMWASSQFYESGLTYLRDQVSSICVCSTRPTSLAAAVGSSSTGISLSKTTTIASSDFTISAGDVSGYKIRVAQFANRPVHCSSTVLGAADHVALVGSTYVLYVTTCTTKALSTSDQVTIPAWDIEIADPTS